MFLKTFPNFTYPQLFHMEEEKKGQKHSLALVLSNSHFTEKELSPREGTGLMQCHRASW